MIVRNRARAERPTAKADPVPMRSRPQTAVTGGGTAGHTGFHDRDLRRDRHRLRRLTPSRSAHRRRSCPAGAGLVRRKGPRRRLRHRQLHPRTGGARPCHDRPRSLGRDATASPLSASSVPRTNWPPGWRCCARTWTPAAGSRSAPQPTIPPATTAILSPAPSEIGRLGHREFRDLGGNGLIAWAAPGV